MKERILLEAERLFWKYGVRSVTMEDIAKQLGISKKTIYQHFDDKEQILYQVVHDKIDRNLSEMDCTTFVGTDPVEDMLNVLLVMQDQANQASPNLLIDMKRYYPQVFALIRQYKERQIITCILENIQKGIEQGLYRADINPAILARLQVQLIELTFDHDVFPTDQYPMSQIQHQLIHHFVRGMLTEQGFDVYNQHLKKHTEYNLTDL